MIEETTCDKLKNFEVEQNCNPFRKYFGYLDDKEMVGYFIIDIVYERIELINIFVKKEKRNSKIATNMLKYLINYGQTNNFLNITLEVKKTNNIAIKLYKNFEFKEVAIREKYYAGVDGILMELVS